jgi:hypothetical protein
MKKIYTNNALFDYPIVENPEDSFWKDEYMSDCDCIECKEYAEALAAYKKWQSSRTEIVGEHPFEEGKVYEKDVHFEIKERWKPLQKEGATNSGTIYQPVFVAIPIVRDKEASEGDCVASGNSIEQVMTPYVAECILKCKDAILLRDLDEAYYWLYKIADPSFERTYMDDFGGPWGKLKSLVIKQTK